MIDKIRNDDENIILHVAIGADHGGFELKEKLKEYFKDKIIFKDLGTNSKESVDYPVIAYATAESVARNETACGIVICKTGVGVSIVANKVSGIRCALCYNKEVGRLCKEHNNANMIAIPADMVTFEDAVDIINNWLDATFLGGRHEKRVAMIEK